MNIRPATQADAAAMAAVHIAARRAAYSHFFPRDYLEGLSLEQSTAIWRDRLVVAGWHLDVADVGGRVVGAAGTCSNSFGMGDSVGELMALHVAPEAWGTGIGTALLRAAETRMLGAGCDRAVLRVYEANERARGFYESRGWSNDHVSNWTDRGGSAIAELRYSRALTAAT